MTSAFLLKSANRDGLQAVDVGRHLSSLAELIELCFGAEMDAAGRAALREMRWLGQLGPLLNVLDWLGMPQSPWNQGFVWVEDGRVIGNASTQRAAGRPHTWLVANVAVHSNYRRRGLGLALMRATLDLVRSRGGTSAILQVDDDNFGALALYHSLGFQPLTTRTAWRHTPRPAAPAEPPAGRRLRPRASGEWADEWALAQRLRAPGLTWNHPLQTEDFAPRPFAQFEQMMIGQSQEHWVASDAAGLAVSLGLQMNWPEGDRLTLLVRPDCSGPWEEPALAHGLRRLAGRPWPVHIEHPAGDLAAEAALRAAGFQAMRTLVWMQAELK